MNHVITLNRPLLLAVSGFSGSGKTTLIEKLIPAIRGYGFNVATIKHDVHGFEMDQQGKDTWRHKRAGASATLITSPSQIGLISDVDHDYDPRELLGFFAGVDIVLAEGFKRSVLPKIEIFRPELGKPPACKGDPWLLALVCDRSLDWGIPRFATDDIDGLVRFILNHFGLKTGVKDVSEISVKTATG